MKYVSAFSSIFAGLLLTVTFSSSAMAAEIPTGAEEPGSASNVAVAEGVSKYALSDEAIAEKCAVSIKTRANMMTVQDDDGGMRDITKCQYVYEVQRQAANRYAEQVDKARADILSTADKCGARQDAVNVQANCVNAGEAMIKSAVASHENLASVADEENTRLAAVAKPAAGAPTRNSGNSTSLTP